MVMTRLLTTLPAGTRALHDHRSRSGWGRTSPASCTWPITTKRWWAAASGPSQEHIEQRLADLTEHMETVIQKYLRNEFETIDEYNAQAGELAEPYRFLVIADFPVELHR